jgi:raffinose/stachyose/melibiose transport system substrate-binding protein
MKRLLSLLLVTSLCIGMTACSGKTDGQGTEKTADQKVEIRLLTRMAGTSKQVGIFKDIIKEFESKHPDAKVIDESQGDESSFNNKLKTDLSSGTLPNIFRIQGVANLSQYIENGVIMDLASVLKEDAQWGGNFVPGALSYYQVPGHTGTYAIPMESGLIGVYYNSALFKKAGIEKFPETWSELKAAIEKLKAIKVTPLALGAKTTYMAGHLHDQIFYKWMGTEAAKKLGTREIKWTDPDVVKTLGFVKELNDMGAFPAGAAGVSDDIVLSQFQKGEAAMIVTGAWNIGNFTNKKDCLVADDIKVAKFPYFEEKPQFKNDDMQVISPYMVSGKLTGKEKDYTIELLKMLTSKEAAKRYAEEASFLIPRTDVEIDSSKVSALFNEVIKLGKTSTGIAVDVFDFDPVASMQDRTRNSIVSMLVGSTPEQAAQEIQSEIDKAAK